MRWIKFSTLGSSVAEVEPYPKTNLLSFGSQGWLKEEEIRALGYLPEDECKLKVAKLIIELYRRPKGLSEYGDFLLMCREASKLFGWEYRCVTYDNRVEPNAKRLAMEFLKQAPEGALTVFFGSGISAGPSVTAGSMWTAAYIVLPTEILEAVQEETQ